MTESVDRVLGRLESKVDTLVSLHTETHERLDALEEWQVEVKQKYAFGKGFVAAVVSASSMVGGLVVWALTTLWGRIA